MIYITEVRMHRNKNQNPEYIEAVRWEHRGSPDENGESTVEEMIDWIENKDGFVHVRDENGNDVRVIVSRRKNARPHLKTESDDESEPDDLLDLPQYGVPPDVPA